MYKNQCHSLYLFKIVSSFTQAIKYENSKQVKIWKKYCVIISLKIQMYDFFQQW